jgi:hypothetical protein
MKQRRHESNSATLITNVRRPSIMNCKILMLTEKELRDNLMDNLRHQALIQGSSDIKLSGTCRLYGGSTTILIPGTGYEYYHCRVIPSLFYHPTGFSTRRLVEDPYLYTLFTPHADYNF